MARDDPHFRLRLPEELRDKLTAAAEAGRRSINAEVVARLEASFNGMPRSLDDIRTHHAEVMEMLRELREALPPED